MKSVRWNTILSDVGDLFFSDLNDKGELIIHVKDRDEIEYLVHFEFCGPYLVSDEGYRTLYWENVEGNIGNTFEVQNSPLISYLSAEPTFEIQCPAPKHFVICTMDVIIEVVSNKYPNIKSYGKGT